MSKVYDFIKECGVFFVLTINDDYPAGRPFGAIMEYNDDLYISTGDVKAVYRQLKKHQEMQIIALKNGTREWVRVNGTAVECNDLEVKRKMLSECPALGKHFASPDAPHFVVFQVKVIKADLY